MATKGSAGDVSDMDSTDKTELALETSISSPDPTLKDVMATLNSLVSEFQQMRGDVKEIKNMCTSLAGGLGDGEALRVVLLGKTGSGKSSLGNALTGKKSPKVDLKDQQMDEKPPHHKDPNVGFKVCHGLRSGTLFCDWAQGEQNGLIVEVTDTPGLCDTHLPEKVIYKEVGKSIAVAEPGPHMIIFTLRCDRRFTQEEYSAYMKIKEIFSEEMNRYLIIVFNGMDAYADMDTIEAQRQCLADNIGAFGKELADMIKQAKGRYFGMNNRASPAEKERQVQDLIKMMTDLVRKNGRDAFYKTEMTDYIMRKVEELAEKEAKAKGVDKSQATAKVKEAIVNEKVEPKFLEAASGAVADRNVRGADNMCSVM